MSPAMCPETLTFSYETASFVRDYLPVFRNNFAQFCAESEYPPELPISTQLYAEKLYLAMFNTTEPSSQMLDETIREFVLSTMSAEPVLLKAWMRMINDYVDVLEESSASTTMLMELTVWIDHISRSLYHSYFLISHESVLDEHVWQGEKLENAQNLAGEYADWLKEAADNEQTSIELDVWAYYRGVPDHFKCRFVAVNDGGLVIEASRFHLAILSKLHHVLITAPDGETRSIAEVRHVDSEQAILQHLEPFLGETDRRDHIRVEPSEPLDVDIMHASGHACGTIVDLSEDSVALYIRNTGVDISKPINLALTLPCHLSPAGRLEMQIRATTATIRSDMRNDPRAHILVLEFVLDTQVQEKLSQYVANRQTEILKEIRHIMEAWK